jgi:hypothetical protein
MASSLSSSSSSYPSHSHSVPGSFEQRENQRREQGERNLGEEDNRQMATGPKNPPKYQRDPQPQPQQRQPEIRSVGADQQPPRYSGYSSSNGHAGPPTFYVDSRYEYGVFGLLLVFSLLIDVWCGGGF